MWAYDVIITVVRLIISAEMTKVMLSICYLILNDAVLGSAASARETHTLRLLQNLVFHSLIDAFVNASSSHRNSVTDIYDYDVTSW